MAATDTTPRRYLVLGSTGYAGVDSVEWTADKLPNIVDHDTVVVDVRSLDDDKLKRVTDDRFREIRTQLTRLLHSQGQIVVLTDFRRTDSRPHHYPENVDNYAWCPIQIGISDESGESIRVEEKRFGIYLQKLKDWRYYLYLPTGCLTRELTELLGSAGNTNYHFVPQPFLANRYGKLLAGAFRTEVRSQRTVSTDFGSRRIYPEKPDLVTGEIVLLPLLPDIEPRAAVAIVLQELTGNVSRSESPEWIAGITLPDAIQIEKEVAARRKMIDEIFNEIRKFEAERRVLEEYKRLLYASGGDLEEIVKKAFEDLGSVVSPAKYGQEEFVIQFEGQECLIEVKGVSKSISLADLRQLTDYLLRSEEEAGRSCKGVLFGNAWRNEPPDQRGTNDKPIFPNNVVQRASQLQISLVPSTTFFAAFCTFLKERTVGPQILRKIIQGTGVVVF